MRQDSSVRRNAITIALLLFLGLIFADIILAIYLLRDRIVPSLANPPQLLVQTERPHALFFPLAINQPAPLSPTQEPVTLTPEVKVHIVEPGDTLLCIANKYGLTLEQLAQANQIENVDWILAGQELIIPAAAASSPNPEGTPTLVPGCP